MEIFVVVGVVGVVVVGVVVVVVVVVVAVVVVVVVVGVRGGGAKMNFDNSTPNMISSISIDITRPRGTQTSTREGLGRPKKAFSNKQEKILTKKII